MYKKILLLTIFLFCKCHASSSPLDLSLKGEIENVVLGKKTSTYYNILLSVFSENEAHIKKELIEKELKAQRLESVKTLLREGDGSKVTDEFIQSSELNHARVCSLIEHLKVSPSRYVLQKDGKYHHILTLVTSHVSIGYLIDMGASLIVPSVVREDGESVEDTTVYDYICSKQKTDERFRSLDMRALERKKKLEELELRAILFKKM